MLCSVPCGPQFRSCSARGHGLDSWSLQIEVLDAEEQLAALCLRALNFGLAQGARQCAAPCLQFPQYRWGNTRAHVGGFLFPLDSGPRPFFRDAAGALPVCCSMPCALNFSVAAHAGAVGRNLGGPKFGSGSTPAVTIFYPHCGRRSQWRHGGLPCQIAVHVLTIPQRRTVTAHSALTGTQFVTGSQAKNYLQDSVCSLAHIKADARPLRHTELDAKFCQIFTLFFIPQGARKENTKPPPIQATTDPDSEPTSSLDSDSSLTVDTSSSEGEEKKDFILLD